MQYEIMYRPSYSLLGAIAYGVERFQNKDQHIDHGIAADTDIPLYLLAMGWSLTWTCKSVKLVWLILAKEVV